LNIELKNKLKNVNLLVPEKLLQLLVEYGNNNYPNEIGGFLIGYYSNDLNTLHITDSLLPQKFNSLSRLFERSTFGIRNILLNLFNTKKQFYVGEWHTHPNGTTQFSNTDLNAMTEIQNHKTVHIKNPILLIISINKDKKADFTFYLYNNGELLRYE